MSTAEAGAEAWAVFCEKFKMAFGNLKWIRKKTYEKIIRDYAMWFEIIISKNIKTSSMVLGLRYLTHENGPSAIPSFGIPV